MKIKLSRNVWRECFAWWPMYVTNGYHDNGSIVWLEFVYRRWNESCGQIETMTKDDYKYLQEMQANIKANPERFGIYRKEY